MTRTTRQTSWVNAALKEFGKFPEEAQAICLAALTIAAEGGKADIAKPMRGLGSGVFEIALPFRGEAFRVVYAVQLGVGHLGCPSVSEEIDVDIKTPKREIDLVKDRLKSLKEMLR